MPQSLVQNSHIASLHAYLLSIRQAYLTTTAPPRHANTHRSTPSYANGKPRGSNSSQLTHLTDPQRDAIDYESKSTLQSLAASVSQLETAEKLRRDTESQVNDKKRNKTPRYAKSLLRWAAGGEGGGGSGGAVDGRTDDEREDDSKRESVDTHRTNVIWYLKMKLREAVAVQGAMVEIRIEREVEKGKSLFWKSTGKGGPNGMASSSMQGDTGEGKGWAGANGHAAEKGGRSAEGMEDYRGRRGNLGIDEKESKEIEKQLSPEQLQLFAQENQEMVKQYEDKLAQVRYVSVAFSNFWDPKSFLHLSLLLTCLFCRYLPLAYRCNPNIFTSLQIFGSFTNAGDIVFCFHGLSMLSRLWPMMRFLQVVSSDFHPCRTAESSLLEISSLQSQLASSLEIQESQITALVEDSSNTTVNIAGGNKELKRAIERWRPARVVFWTTVGLCGFLVSWDLVF